MSEEKELRIRTEEYNETDPLRHNAEDPVSIKKKGVVEICGSAFKNITVEPSMFFFVMSCVLTIQTSQNLGLEKACRVNLNFTSEICDSLKSQTAEAQNDYEREVQKLVTVTMAWKTYMTSTIPCALAMFVGSWSDKTGYRKIFIMITVFGQFLICLNGMFHTFYFDLTNLEAFVASEGILEGFTGSWCIAVLTMFSFISAITNTDNRTFRMGIINLTMTVGFPIGMSISGIFIKSFGYYGCYGFAGTINLLNFLYNTFILKDPERTAEQKEIPEDIAMAEKQEIRKGAEEYHETDPLKDNAESPANKKKRSFKENCVNVLKNITVEPSMFFFVISFVLIMQTSQNLSLEKACRVNLNFTNEICDSLKSQTVEAQNEYEREVQKLVTVTMSWKTYITATIPCALALFIGSWSDKTGYRKMFILMPVFGQFLVCLNGIFHTFYFDHTNLEAFVASEGIIEGFSGSWCISLLTMFSFISAITNNDNRTFRMGIINLTFTVGFPIGTSVSGIFLKTFGYYGCYGLAGSLNVLNFLYNAFILKDPERTAEQKEHDKKGLGHFVRIFFDITNVKKTFQVVFYKGENNRRLRLCVFLIVVSILFGPMHGELSIMYISTRYRFNWDEVKFSIFQAYNFIAHTAGTLFSIVVFSKHLQWHDSVLGIISTVSKIAASFVYCFAPNERIFFIAPIVDILNGTALLALRSTVSKLVAADEFGRVNSIFALTENTMPLIYIPLYTRVYTATMQTLPGAVFLLGSGMTLPAVIVFIWLFYEHRRNLRRGKRENASDDTVKIK